MRENERSGPDLIKGVLAVFAPVYSFTSFSFSVLTILVMWHQQTQPLLSLYSNKSTRINGRVQIHDTNTMKTLLLCPDSSSVHSGQLLPTSITICSCSSRKDFGFDVWCEETGFIWEKQWRTKRCEIDKCRRKHSHLHTFIKNLIHTKHKLTLLTATLYDVYDVCSLTSVSYE